MRQIGFKTMREQMDERLPAIIKHEEKTSNISRSATADEILRAEGFMKAIEVLEDYFSNYKHPLVRGERRHEWMKEKIQKIRERYFDSI